MKFQAIKGVRDILPPESALWNRVEQTAREVFATYGFGEIRLPTFELARLFEHSIGDETDIVTKELYFWIDSPQANRALRSIRAKAIENAYRAIHDDQNVRVELFKQAEAGSFDTLNKANLLCLRPEATASVCRAYIENEMHTLPGNVKLYYIGPMFRRERPQKGRYRQFYQIGAEVLGQSDAPAIDAEVIEMLMHFFARAGLSGKGASPANVVAGFSPASQVAGTVEKHADLKVVATGADGTTLYINSIGCKDCRPKYVAELKAALEKVRDKLGPDSQRRIETNPLRVLDSKLPEEQAVIEKLPRITEHLCEACRDHYTEVKKQLALRGVVFLENGRLVRGLDYYMRTTFEITAPGLGSQNAVCGGGRYDGLVELLGGPPTKGIGFAIGTDRLILSLQEAEKLKTGEHVGPPLRLDVFVAWMGTTSQPVAVNMAQKLRAAGFSVEVPAEEMKFKKSIGLADKLGARFALIIGENEIAEGKFALKRLADGYQESFSEAELLAHMKSQQK